MDWFIAWAEEHCEATGGGAETMRVLLANRHIITGPPWSATRDELAEVSARLVRECRVPRWPNEHTDAIGRELRLLRAAAAVSEVAADCPACGGSGYAIVPVAACVWEGQVILHPTHKRLITGAVLCDRPGCEAGERAIAAERARLDKKPHRPRLSLVERTVAGRDLPAMLRVIEHAAAVDARRRLGAGPLYPTLEAILANARRAAQDRARDANDPLG